MSVNAARRVSLVRKRSQPACTAAARCSESGSLKLWMLPLPLIDTLQVTASPALTWSRSSVAAISTCPTFAASNPAGCPAAGRRAALQARQRSEDLRRGQDLLDRYRVARGDVPDHGRLRVYALGDGANDDIAIGEYRN